MRRAFADFGSWIFDFLTLRPEGRLPFDDEGKDAYGVLTAALAFVATQSGALAVAEKINVKKPIALAFYCLLSVISICLIARLLTLPRQRKKKAVHYFDRGSILFGKFVFYVSVIASLAFAIAYALGIFSPTKLPFKAESVPMSPPLVLTDHANNTRSIVTELLGEKDAMSLQRFARAMSTGLEKGHSSGKVYVSWSTSPFDQDYDEFRCEVFGEVKFTPDCLAFLYTSYPTKFGTVQLALRQLYFDVAASGFPTTTFVVRSPMAGDRLLLIFWSDAQTFPADLALANRTVRSGR